MSSLDWRFSSATHVVERPVGGVQPNGITLPRPTGPQNSFHPFRYSPITAHSPMKPLSPSPPSLPVPGVIPQAILQPSPILECPSTSYAQSSSRTVQPRKPQSRHTVTASQLRPHIAAADHLFTWDTPFAARHHQKLAEELPPLLSTLPWQLSGVLWPPTRSLHTPCAHFASHNSVISGIFLRKNACQRATPCSVPSLTNTRVCSQATQLSRGCWVCTAGM